VLGIFLIKIFVIFSKYFGARGGDEIDVADKIGAV
jgi:hypothetical protein